MATTQKKTTSSSRSGSSRGSGTGSSARSGRRSSSARGSSSRASGSSRSRSAGKNTKRPIRREVTGIAFLIAALCVLVSYFTEDGWLIALLPALFKGLFGFGFYLIAPALVVGAWILLTHKGRPVVLRTACALLVPYLFGGLCHMLFCRQNLTADGLLPKLPGGAGQPRVGDYLLPSDCSAAAGGFPGQPLYTDPHVEGAGSPGLSGGRL